ncbi:MAG: cytochrome P460 family protein [Anaerolineae bacterium]
MHRAIPVRIVSLIVFALLFAACAPAATQPPAPKDTPVPPPTDTPVPVPTDTPVPEVSPDEAMAQERWQELQAANYQENWITVPGKGTLYKGQSPHGALLSTYLNPEAAEAMKLKKGDMAADAIIVKENYMPDGTLDALTVMYKEPGYDPDHGDWFWAKFGADGTVQAAGKPAGCISCHGSARSNDYIFTFPIAPIQAAAVPPTDEVMSMAKELWEKLQEADYQDKWITVPGKGTLYEGQAPHGALLSTYLNPEAAETMKSKSGDMTADAIIVKENYMPDGTLVALTVMYKKPDYDPNHRDWFWAKFGADGTIQAAGKPTGCIACHGSVRSNDYIFTFPIAPISPSGPPPAVEMPEVEEVAEKPAAEMPPAPSAEDVAALVAKGGCGGCHTAPGIEGAAGVVAPNWCDTAKKVQSGEKDVAYIQTSILDPNAEVVEGFPANIMPQTFGDLFTEDEVNTLAAFIANLKCE